MSAQDLFSISLVMIVKDEARGIQATLESALPFVDSCIIVDTGSRDGTQEIVRKVMSTVPGKLESAEFIDFATTRNQALDIADRFHKIYDIAKSSVFYLLLNGDDVLKDGKWLRLFCGMKIDDTDGAYYVRIEDGDLSYDSARLMRASARWRYDGVTHEVLCKEGEPPPTSRVPGASIVQDGKHVDKRARWELDRELLKGQLIRSPKHTRSWFYLAQTHECLGDYREAMDAYRVRISLGGWQEEVYESRYRVARCLYSMREEWPIIQQAYLDAHAHSPSRAEPLYAIAYHYYQTKNWPLAYLFASQASALPFPEQATLFVDRSVYEHKAVELRTIAEAQIRR